MAAFLRTFDWRGCPLGPPSEWPAALRNMVSVMMENRHPMAVWWGPEFLHLYNDAYRPILGDKHPAALCRGGAEVWQDSWRIIGPMAQAVLDGAGATWNEDFLFPVNRRGFLEETYFTFSYSPIPDGDRAGGVLVTTRETTAEVVARRQVRTLLDLARHATRTRNVDEALAGAARVLADDAADLPFALLYRAAPGSTTFSLAGAAPADQRVNPDCWPFEEASGRKPMVVGDVRRRVGDMPGGAWDEPPEQAVVVPLAREGLEANYGFLVAGISPRRRLDEGYLSFITTVADAIVAGVLNALSYEAERNRAEKLAELDRAKTVFFSNVSHEFRTPLTLMLGPTEDLLLGLHGPLAERQRTALELVQRNEVRLLRLVDSLLQFARVEAGRSRATFARTDVAGLTRSLCGQFRSAVERAGLTLTVTADPPEVWAYVDRDMWEHIVLNLMSNALKFTFAGGISVALRGDDRSIVLEVTDSGVGIEPAHLPRVFERFYRAGDVRSRSFEGSGIGLALAHELVQQHGGRIAAASEPGRGSTFTVTIPAGADHLPAAQVVPMVPVRHSRAAEGFVAEALRWLPEAAGRPPVSDVASSILVADDNADMRDYLCTLVGSRWPVVSAVDGEEAWLAVQAYRPLLIVSDVMMPRLDGFGLLQRLRNDPELRDTPFLMLSARAGEEATVEGLQAGADDYLVKPFSARELLARVATHLELARLRNLAAAESRQLARAVELNELVARMLGHDLRSGLTGILAASQLALRRAPGESVATPLRRVIAGGERMARMVAQLQDLTALREAGAITLRRAELDLVELCREVAAGFEAERAVSRLTVTASGSTRGAWDSDRLFQIVGNLVSNALEHGDPDGPVTMLVDGTATSEVVLTVHNRGVMPAPRLAAPFVPELHRQRTRAGGLGIGLYIVRQLTLAHGGVVGVDSAAERGTSVRVTLPRAAPEGKPPRA